MKEYIKQFYNDGLATTFYKKPINFIEKYVKNKKTVKIIKIIIKVFYTLCAIIFMLLMFKNKLPKF